MRTPAVNILETCKWGGTVGYALTGLDITPYNGFSFAVGLILWSGAGIMQRDKALALCNLIALAALGVRHL